MSPDLPGLPEVPGLPDDEQLGLMLQASMRRDGPPVLTDLDEFGVRVLACSRRVRLRRRLLTLSALLAALLAISLAVAQVWGDPTSPAPVLTPSTPLVPRGVR